MPFQEDTEIPVEQRSLGTLWSDLTHQLTTLFRKEMDLARVEMTQNVSGMVKDVIIMAVGGALLYAGFLVLLAAIVIGLSQWMAMGLAALIVSVTVLCIGAIIYITGKSRLQKKSIRPTQTIISLKENKTWIKQRI